MHETRIARSILEVLTYRIGDSSRACAAASVSVKVGELRDVNVDGLLFAFDAIKEDYPNCAHCKLVASKMEASARCISGHKYHPHGNHSYCSVCGDSMAELLFGQELEITRITLFDGEGVHQGA
jgi:Zn finger protein HypA/HybF involved in hydrogenase expression